jgi:hypothetical protein
MTLLTVSGNSYSLFDLSPPKIDTTICFAAPPPTEATAMRMNLGDSKQQQHLQILIWRAMDTRAESETAPFHRSKHFRGPREREQRLVPSRIARGEIVRWNVTLR